MMKRTAESAAAVVLANAACSTAALLGQSGRIYDPRRYGAKGDGATLDTRALQTAIDACAVSGGGTVLLAPGTYVSGTITLKSDVTLQIQAGATILGSPNPDDYVLPPEGLAATQQKWAKRLIFAIGARNVTILGPGTIDGNNKQFMVSSHRPPTRPEDEYRDIAAFGTHRTAGISPMVQLVDCTNLRVENILLQNADGWTLNPMGCHQVVIRKVTVRNAIDASNTDGIDPSSCQDVLIEDCDIVTGDDGICVKNFNIFGVGSRICRNIDIVRCRVSSCTNALRVGVEGWGPFENVRFTDCEVYAVPGPLNTSPAAGICLIMWEGTSIDGVSFTNIKMAGARVPIYARLQTTDRAMQARAAKGVPLAGRLENVSFSGIRATGAIYTSSITGIADLHLRNVSLTDLSIETSEPGQLAWTAPPVKEAETVGPGPFAFGRLPCYGLYLRHIDGLTIKNVDLRSKAGDPRPMLTCDDISLATVENVTGTPGAPGQPLLDLRNMKDAVIQDNKAPAGTGVYARVSGADTHHVRFQRNDLSESITPLVESPEVPPDGVESVR